MQDLHVDDVASPSIGVDPKVIDPVCGMKVDPTRSVHRADHGGQTFHFCSAGCLKKFESAPESYLKPKAPAPTHAGAIYTCPMHPEIR